MRFWRPWIWIWTLSVGLLAVPALANVSVEIEPFEVVPPSAGSTPLARINVLREAPDASGRLFVNDLRGPLWSIDALTVTEYLDLADEFPLLKTSPGLASGFVSFAFDPEFGTSGLFYTVHVETVGAVAPNFGPALPIAIEQHSILTEWTASVPSAATFAGTKREVLRIAAPHRFHNMGEIAFNPTAGLADPDYRLLYIGAGDYGSVWVGDPDQLQRLDTLYGAILRIDPRGAGHHDYAIPPDNPFVDGNPLTFDEIWAYGVRNSHRLSWDEATGNLYAMEIGEDNAEEINLVTKGTNYGWPFREGNWRIDPYVDPGTVFALTPADLVDDATFGYTYPVLTYDHVLGSAIAGGLAIRAPGSALDGRFLFGDIVSGEMWVADIAALEAADDGDPTTMASFEDVDLEVLGLPTTLLDLVRDAAGDPGIWRADLRLGRDATGQLYATTKGDGVVRTLPEPGSAPALAAGAILMACLSRARRRSLSSSAAASSWR